MKHSIIWILLLSFTHATASEMIPFTWPGNSAPVGVADLSSTLERPAGGAGWIEVRDGHYFKGEERIRFYGVNLAAAACFPPQELASSVADRLARCGFNVVRFHHMDNNWTESLLNFRAGDSSTIDPEKLDRLDRLIAELKAVGIYSNINLLCARPFNSKDGLAPGVDGMDWKQTHVLGFFDEGARNLQKAFAQELLLHVNPYTGLSYAEDPAVAFVEINNENGLIHQWFSGALDSLPSHYTGVLRTRWNAWLAQKYSSTVSLIDAWQVQQEPLGAELLAGDLTGDSIKWVLENHATASASRSAINYDSTIPGVRISVARISGEGWHVQFNHPGLHVVNGKPYTVGFWARSEQPRAVSLSVMQASDPWANLGFEAELQLSNDWKWFEFTFSLNASDSNARLNFGNLGSSTGWIDLAGVTLRPGGTLGGLKQGETLEERNLSLVRKSEPVGLDARRDWFSFLRELEVDYWSDMETFIRLLGYRGLTWGSTIMNSSPHAQAVFASADSHAYWQHPAFPGGDWDPVHWTVNNVSMVNDRSGGVISELAWQRILGKPHNVTEYQHPSPNTFSSEGPLFVSAYGAFQDWDGIYYFHYGSSDTDWERGTFSGFFDLDRHPTKLANAILGSLMFRKQWIRSGEAVHVAPFDPNTELDVMLSRGGAWNVADGRHLDLPQPLPLVRRFALDLSPVEAPALESESNLVAGTDPVNLPAPWELDQKVTDTGEITWDHSLADRAAVVVNAPRVKGVWGFQSDRIWDLGGFSIQCMQSRQNWASIVMVLKEGDSFDDLSNGGRALLVSTGDIENTNMGWTDSTRVSVGNQWGQAPVRVENLTVQMGLPVPADHVRIWALSPSGARAHSLPVSSEVQGSTVQLGGEHGSMWYEIEFLPSQN